MKRINNSFTSKNIIYAIYKYNNKNKVVIPLTNALEVVCLADKCYVDKIVNNVIISSVHQVTIPYTISYIYDKINGKTYVYCNNNIIMSLNITPMMVDVRALKETFIFETDTLLVGENFNYIINAIKEFDTSDVSLSLFTKQDITNKIINNEQITIFIDSLNESQFKLIFDKYSFYSSAQYINSKKFENNNKCISINDSKVYVNNNSNGITVNLSTCSIVGTIDLILCS